MIDSPGLTGLAVLAADRSVSFADESARALLDCAPAECAERLRPALGSLPAVGSAMISLAVGGPSDPDTISRKLRIEAHALSRGAGWLLLIHDAAERDGFESMLADSMRARLWARLRPALHHDFKAPIQSMLWSIEILVLAADRGHRCRGGYVRISRADSVAMARHKHLSSTRDGNRRRRDNGGQHLWCGSRRDNWRFQRSRNGRYFRSGIRNRECSMEWSW